MWAWPGSRDHDNCTVQTAAMGQIPRSTERILVENKTAGLAMSMSIYYLSNESRVSATPRLLKSGIQLCSKLMLTRSCRVVLLGVLENIKHGRYVPMYQCTEMNVPKWTSKCTKLVLHGSGPPTVPKLSCTELVLPLFSALFCRK